MPRGWFVVFVRCCTATFFLTCRGIEQNSRRGVSTKVNRHVTLLLSFSLGATSAGCTADLGILGGPPQVDEVTVSPPSEKEPEACLPSARVVRLSDRQYNRSSRDLLGDSESDFTLETPGSAKNAFVEPRESQSVNVGLATQLRRIAEDGAQNIELAPGSVDFSCSLSAVDATCVEAWIQRFVSRALRRPLEEGELEDYRGLFEVGSEDGIESGVSLVVEAVLQSPSYFYQTEVGAGPWPQSGAEVDEDGEVELTSYELASAISFWLLESLPDEALWESAQDGSLLDPAVASAHVARLLLLPGVREDLNLAILRWFDLLSLLDSEKDPDLYPQFGAARDLLVKSVELSVGDALWNGGDIVASLYGGTEMYVQNETAAFFGVTADSSVPALTQVPASERKGLITHPAIMARFSGPSETQVVQRGLLIRREILCQELPSPPAGLDIESAGHGLTQREFADYRAEQAVCRGCHTSIDPFGLMFEIYDAVGSVSRYIGRSEY